MTVAETTGFTPAWAPTAITERHGSTGDDPITQKDGAAAVWMSAAQRRSPAQISLVQTGWNPDTQGLQWLNSSLNVATML